MIEDLDRILTELVNSASKEVELAKAKNFFSKDFAEAICIVLSMAYGRWGNKDDK